MKGIWGPQEDGSFQQNGSPRGQSVFLEYSQDETIKIFFFCASLNYKVTEQKDNLSPLMAIEGLNVFKNVKQPRILMRGSQRVS